jgi:hypothetical protein
MGAPKTIDRIQKLLRLAESSNVHEAATAAARAQELMTRHRIDLAAIRTDDAVIEDHRDRPLVASSRVPRWRVMLASAVAETNGCRVYVRRTHAASELVIVGTGDDAASVLTLDAHLSTEVDRLTRRLGHGRGRRWCNGFRLGAVTTLALRLREARTSARAQARHEARHTAHPSGSQALVCIDGALQRLDEREAAVETFMRERLRLCTAPRRTLRPDADAYTQGRHAAATVDIDPRARLPRRCASSR